MTRSTKLIFSLAFITLVSFVFRFYQLTQYPVSPGMDEMSIGFNAYSILKTQHDEWGKFLPLAFQSVGDYKPPINIYLTSLSILIFGFTEFALRFPSAFFGSITPLALYFFLRKLKLPPSSCLLTALWLAVLPYHIHFSRGGFEAVTALFFTLLALTFLFSWLDQKKSSHLFLCVLFASTSIWAYHAQRLFIPVSFLGILYLHKTKLQLIKYKKVYLLALALGSLLLGYFFYLSFFTPAIVARAGATSLLGDSTLTSQFNGNFIHDKSVLLTFWFGRFINYLDPKFLFSTGLRLTPPNLPNFGLFFLVDILPLSFGIFSLIKSKRHLTPLLALLFVSGALPASLTINDQHPLRALTLLPFFSLLICLGFAYLQNSSKKLLLLVYLLFLPTSLLYFKNLYTIQFPYYFSEYWQYGFAPAAKYACDNQSKYDRIYFGDTFGSQGPLNTGLPYLYVLFYCKTDPLAFQKTRTIPKFYFQRQVLAEVQRLAGKTLIIASPWDFVLTPLPKDKIIDTIYFKNGKIAFYLLEINN